jgi:hypothetical protein
MRVILRETIEICTNGFVEDWTSSHSLEANSTDGVEECAWARLAGKHKPLGIKSLTKIKNKASEFHGPVVLVRSNRTSANFLPVYTQKRANLKSKDRAGMDGGDLCHLGNSALGKHPLDT